MMITAHRPQMAASAMGDAAAEPSTRSRERTSCCIVGAGPAGATLGLLLARQGVAVTLLEAHTDFDRDFRGDIIHPSTLELMDQLGLIDRVLRIPHAAIGPMPLRTRAGVVPFGARPWLRSKYPDMLQLPQAQFLELVISEARRYSSFRLVLGARVQELIKASGRIIGVRYRTHDGQCEIEADLTVAADGRFSKVRQLAGVELVGDAQPIDYLWFRLPHLETDPPGAGGVYAGEGQVMVLLDRGVEWQVSYWLPKGGYQELRAMGLDALRRSLALLAPWLADRSVQLRDWSQVSLLAVESSRARRWYRPGLLLIGDAAHVMLPVGGVGINMAIQDAVAAANLLGPRLAAGDLRRRDLAALQRRREWPTRLVQGVQSLMQREMLRAGQVDWAGPIRVPTLWRLAERLPQVRGLRTRLLAYGGLWPERVRVDPADHNLEAAQACSPPSGGSWSSRSLPLSTSATPTRFGCVAGVRVEHATEGPASRLLGLP